MGPASYSQLLRRVSTSSGSFATWCAIVTFGFLVIFLGTGTNTASLMPGPLTTSHRFTDGCTTCHSNTRTGQFGWLHGLVRFASPIDDSTACLACHVPDAAVGELRNQSAFSPHGLAAKTLAATARSQNTRHRPVTTIKNDRSAVDELREWLVASDTKGPETVFCATCHKEHKGSQHDLTTMADQRCHTCHQTKFDTFDTNHPQFVSYPFRRRTRLIFDHAKHFGTHFKETRSKRPDAKNIPDTCASCHDATQDKRHMSVKPFEQTCATCHLPQIVGADRATGAKGIALVSLPALDLDTLRDQKAPIGEWPEQTDAELATLMPLLMAGADAREDVLLTATKLDLQDLSQASKAEIDSVVALVWQIKSLIHNLATSKASDLLKRIEHKSLGTVDKAQIAQLLATLPRDVLVNAQREWLPNLTKEMAQRGRKDWKKTLRIKPLTSDNADEPATQPSGAEEVDADKLLRDPSKGRWYVNVLGEIVQEGAESEDAKRVAKGEVEGPAEPDVAAAPIKIEPEQEPDNESRDTDAGSAVDAENWSEFGGWYRKDFAVLYKPQGHADAFLRAWLDFTGSRRRASNANTQRALASSAFQLLNGKDAQGQCTKCHSVDTTPDQARVVQWSPSSATQKKRRFTRFVHEPHFSVLDERGCITCHELDAPKDLKASYSAGDPRKFISNFKSIKKRLCASCHKAETARQDCQLCHTYHVAPIQTPITDTKLPATAQEKNTP